MILLLFLWYSYNSAFVISLFYIPIFVIPPIISPIVGTHVDKFSKKKTGFISILLSLISLVPLFFFFDIYAIFIIFIILIIFETYFNLNYTVAMKIIVGEKRLIYANNLFITSAGITNFVGYIAGAFLYSYIPFTEIIFLIFIFYLISLIIWMNVRIKEKKEGRKDKIKYSEIFGFLRKNKNLFNLIILYDFLVLFTIIIISPAYVPYCFNLLRMSKELYGEFNGITTLFLVFVPLILYKFIKSENTEKYAVTSILYEGIITISIAFIPFLNIGNIYKIVILIIFSLLMSFPSTLEYSSYSTIFQKNIPNKILGRVYSVRSMIRGLVNGLGLIAAGYFTDILGPIPLILLSGVILLLIVPFARRIIKNIKNSGDIGVKYAKQ